MKNDHLNKEISQPQIAHSNDKIGKLSLFSVLLMAMFHRIYRKKVFLK